MTLPGVFAISALLAFQPQAPTPAAPAEAQKGFRPVTAAFHIHTRFSNGAYDISELAAFARQRRIDVLGVSDSFLTRVRFGIGPLKKLVSQTMKRPGVLDRGVDEYFDSFERVQQAYPDLVLLPGLEVAPYYYWRGDWRTRLELHDFDRHILVFGMRDREAVRNLPVIENERWANTSHDLLRAAGPLIAFLVALLIGAVGAAARNRKMYLAAFAIALPALLWSYDAYPFGRFADPYSGKPDIEPFQKVIDYVAKHGGLTFWSYPEARFPDVLSGRARMISIPHPETLSRTKGYRGFEGLYGDKITITNPGNLWDQLLMEHLRGAHNPWPSVVTGLDFHFFKPAAGWYELDHGLTVLFSAAKTEAAVTDALRNGRGYATFQENPDRRLGIEDFALRSNGNVAISGETLKAGPEVEFGVSVRWMTGAAEGEGAAAAIQIIRDGSLIERYENKTPAVLRRRETLAPGRHYYRIIVDAGVTRILSNPIFCDVSLPN